MSQSSSEELDIDQTISKSSLEANPRQLDLVEKELQEAENYNESELRKLNRQKKMYAFVEQEKADERMLKLAENQKKEKEELYSRIMELEKQLDAKQALELEIERLEGCKRSK